MVEIVLREREKEKESMILFMDVYDRLQFYLI